MVGKCQGKTKDGKPCSATPRPDSDWCPWHDPALAGQRSTWSAKGGANRSNKARATKDLPAEPLSNAEVHAYMSMAFRRTFVGKMEPGVFTALANGARTIAELSRATSLEQQVADLARKIAALDDRRTA